MTMTHQLIRNAGAMLALCLGLAGCHSASDPSSVSLEQSMSPPSVGPSQMMALTSPGQSAPSSHAPSQPVASLPAEAGAVGSVREHEYVNGFRQDILLKGNAVKGVPNSLTLLTRTTRQTTLDEATPLFKPTEPAIRAELGRQFPHIAMQVVERSSTNNYGPYGLALGRGPGTIRCLYMWQWIDENRLPAEAGVTGPMSVRIRLCQADTTFDAMAALVDRLSIGGGGAVAGVGGSDIVAGPTEAAPTKAAPRRHLKRVAAHRVRRVNEARRDPVANETPFTAPLPANAAPAMPTPLSTDLPPQAYLGPKKVN